MLRPTATDQSERTWLDALGVDDSPYQVRVFQPVDRERERIIDALVCAESITLLRLACKMRDCCRSPMLMTDAEGDALRLSERRCRSRCCPRCRRFRSREVQHRLLAAVRKMDARRFVTLTMQSNDDPLADQLDVMRKAFSKLRRQAFWKRNVTGGVYCIEVTYNVERRQWHPHLHAIIDGEYVPKSALSAGWKEATGGSFVVDIRRVHSASGVASYVAKYVAKSDDASEIPDPALAEWATSIQAMRLVHTFGNLHGVALLEKPERQPGVNVQVLSPSILVDAMHHGDVVASRILDAIDAVASGGDEELQRSTMQRIRTWQRWKKIEQVAADRAARSPPETGDPGKWTLK